MRPVDSAQARNQVEAGFCKVRIDGERSIEIFGFHEFERDAVDETELAPVFPP